MRRRALVILAAVVPLAAIVVAIVIAGGGSTSAPRKLPLAAGAGGGFEANAARADMALYPYRPVRYEAASDLPLLGGSAHAYEVTDDVSDGSIRRLAGALGVEGELVEQDGFVTVGPEESQLSVQRAAGGAWYFNSGRAVASSGVAVACAPDAVCDVPPTTVPERPAGLPSEAQAKAQALTVLTAGGLDVDHSTVIVNDYITQWNVTADPIIDDKPVRGYTFAVSIGPDGVEYANGFLGVIVRADEYPLIDTRAAIEQLNSNGGYYGGGPEPALAVDTPAAAAVETTTTTIVCVTTPCETPSRDAVPPEGGIPPETIPEESIPEDTIPTDTLPPQVITLTGVELGLMFVPSYNSDTAYLVPAYLFSTPDGDGPTALAIDDEYLLPPDEGTDSGATTPGGGAGGSDPGTMTEVPCSTPGYTGKGPCYADPAIEGESAPPDTATTVP